MECEKPSQESNAEINLSNSTENSNIDNVFPLRTASAGQLRPPPSPPSARPSQAELKIKSFVSAIHLKYDISVNGLDSVIHIPNKGPVKVTDSGTIILPKQVSMSGQDISCAGDPNLIKKMCQRVQELDLMENNITCWDEIVTILDCSPELVFLNLTKNCLSGPASPLISNSFPCLSDLVLNFTTISWNSLLHLLEAFPNLKELHLSKNNFTSVDLPVSQVNCDEIENSADAISSALPTVQSALNSENASQMSSCYPSLEKLHFVGNSVKCFKEISKLGKYFPSLKYLMLSETALEYLEDAENLAQECFPNLALLGLSNTLLSGWSEIEKLKYFPALTDIRLKGIPFLEGIVEKQRRLRSIALLPKLKTLNGSKVSDTEREDAERAYIREFQDASEKSARFIELSTQYGRLDDLAKVNLKPPKHVRLHLEVRSEAIEGTLLKEMDINVGLAWTARDLKKQIEAITETSMKNFKIWFISSMDAYPAEKIHSNTRKMHSYNMEEGETLVAVVYQ